MSIAPLHRDTRGDKPLVPPHLLKRILKKVAEREAKSCAPTAKSRPDGWANIDKLAEAMEAAR